MSTTDNVQTLPVLPIKNTVLFPLMLMPLNVGRPSSIAATEAALASEGKEIVVVAQRDASIENPALTDLYSIGTKSRDQKDGAQVRRIVGSRLVGCGAHRGSDQTGTTWRLSEGAHKTTAAARRKRVTRSRRFIARSPSWQRARWRSYSRKRPRSCAG